MYEVAFRGRVVARLVQVAVSHGEMQPDGFWEELDRMAAGIGEMWPSELTAEEAVREQRREF